MNVIFENDDAGTIYANVDFAGMKAEDAIKIVIEQSVISGHFELSGDEVQLEVAGSVDADVKKLQQIAKAKIEEICQTLGVQVTVDVEQLSATARKAALVAKAVILAPEKTQEDLEAMSEKELVELIKDKQEQLKGLVYEQVEQIKTAYGEVENAVIQQIQSLKASLKEKQDLLDAKIEELESLTIESLKQLAQQAIDGYRSAITTLESQIDTALENYETAKQNAIDSLKTQYEAAKNALVSAYKTQVESANSALIEHLDAKLDNGTITQEQYNYWKQLAESNMN